MSDKDFSILNTIDYPSDLRQLPADLLPELCFELREFIIDTVSRNGGHFAASLGVVELTVALHYVFNTPYDQLVWDVGHQAYGHKILTGRRDVFHTNRKYNGISGFPKRDESEYDTFGVGHSSTSISAALGMAIASRLKGEYDRHHVAIIGDGSMTAGIAFEAMNHAGITDAELLIVLNDNGISIDPIVGAFNHYLTRLRATWQSNYLKDKIEKLATSTAPFNLLGRAAQHLNKGIRDLLPGKGDLFEAFGIRYFGPVDGHDIRLLVPLLEDLKQVKGPKLLHVITTKGKGYALAESSQTVWHAPGLFDKHTGEIFKKQHATPQPPKYQDVFGETLMELAEKNDTIMAITPAMPSGSSLKHMIEKMPGRVFDVDICEQHAVTLSAGLATQGMRVFCNIYSTFMQRAYDQLIHDVVIQHLPVVFCLDRGGLVGEDGTSHHGVFDLAYTRSLPGIIVSAPMNEQELRNLMFTAQLPSQHQPFVIRYPRGQGVMPYWRTPFEEVPVGVGRCIRKGTDVAILSLGHPGNFVLAACTLLDKEGINAAHYDMRFLKPLDESLLHEVFQHFHQIVTIEDGSVAGGFGSAVLEFMVDNHYQADVHRLGVPDRLISHGKVEELYAECGYDTMGIVREVKAWLVKKHKLRS
ncbi:1-deoxy-D-xylulose-5-phosphate synthase [Chitinophaga sp. Mgbs1]|uniref:1-deoxy-D-xylulose-5-phosphate synthase n=1 Tax=Chitinophaga solisilvae TaxID=1233460 RepID=A0A433WM88_9BACT|nr:1-deoxy-D-xylulose-5-phosphate synthase [Chitinophaga solisilvae]